jgi:hypothetical protein
MRNKFSILFKNIFRPLFKILPKFITEPYHIYTKKNHLENIYNHWISAGKPIPVPHVVKQRTISEFQNMYKLDTFIETGTYLGEMVEAQLHKFEKLISIELSPELWKSAKEKFQNKVNVTILLGDSGEKLGEVIPLIQDKALFWLDGHYSEGITARGVKDCPIYEELSHILISNYNHVILIDDARCFIGQGDYPTMAEVSEIVLQKRPNSQIDVKDDIIRIVLN